MELESQQQILDDLNASVNGNAIKQFSSFIIDG